MSLEVTFSVHTLYVPFCPEIQILTVPPAPFSISSALNLIPVTRYAIVLTSFHSLEFKPWFPEVES